MLPAHAGMIPNVEYGPHVELGAPRTCGDDPLKLGYGGTKKECSPHMRG